MSNDNRTPSDMLPEHVPPHLREATYVEILQWAHACVAMERRDAIAIEVHKLLHRCVRAELTVIELALAIANNNPNGSAEIIAEALRKAGT